jgi:hypothetical protein
MSSILRTAQSELRKHNLDTFTDKPNRVVTTGRPHCTKSFYTISQFVDHLAEDVLPEILERAFSVSDVHDMLQRRSYGNRDDTQTFGHILKSQPGRISQVALKLNF